MRILLSVLLAFFGLAHSQDVFRTVYPGMIPLASSLTRVYNDSGAGQLSVSLRVSPSSLIALFSASLVEPPLHFATGSTMPR